MIDKFSTLNSPLNQLEHLTDSFINYWVKYNVWHMFVWYLSESYDLPFKKNTFCNTHLPVRLFLPLLTCVTPAHPSGLSLNATASERPLLGSGPPLFILLFICSLLTLVTVYNHLFSVFTNVWESNYLWFKFSSLYFSSFYKFSIKNMCTFVILKCYL